MILILSAETDPHASVVYHQLVARGAPVTWFDPGCIPATARAVVRLGSGGQVQRTIERDGAASIDLEAVTAVWHRRPRLHAPCASISDAGTREYIVDECTEFFVHLIDSLDCLQVPAPRPIFRRAENKTAQLLQAAAVGLEIPETLAGNSPRAFLEFFGDSDGRLISKMPTGTLVRRFGFSEFSRYTERVGLRDVRQVHALRHSPVLFQSYVDKAVELRVTVVGDRVLASEIHSQATPQTQLDWRHYDHLNTPLRKHAMPERVADQCRAVVDGLGLKYGALDLIVTPDGRYVFIEINPNGQYLWIEEETGLPISAAICDLLGSSMARASAA